MSKILVYVRPWSRDQFVNIATLVWPDRELVEISEHRSVDLGGFSSEFYSAFNQLPESTHLENIDDIEVSDVILRCRLLRAIDSKLATQIAVATNKAIETLLNVHSPEAVLSVTVDSYIQHLLFLACRRRCISFLGLVPSFVNGYFRLTALGERRVLRQVSDLEVDQVLVQMLNKSYKPEFLAKSPLDLRRNARKIWFRNLPKPTWFALRRKLSADPMNYHYWSTENVARNYWSLRVQNYRGCIPKSRDDLPRVTRNRPLIFLPLQMSPEATVDYWSEDTDWITYEDRVCDLLSRHEETHAFLIKEHPNVLGYRHPGFYERLRQHSNCILVAAEANSNSMIELCDAVVFCTGSVGFEAALRGVPVYSDSKPFHLPADLPLSIASLTDDIRPKELDESQQRRLIRYLLEGLLPGRFVNDGSWRKSDTLHIKANTEVAKSLREFCLPLV